MCKNSSLSFQNQAFESRHPHKQCVCQVLVLWWLIFLGYCIWNMKIFYLFIFLKNLCLLWIFVDIFRFMDIDRHLVWHYRLKEHVEKSSSRVHGSILTSSYSRGLSSFLPSTVTAIDFSLTSCRTLGFSWRRVSFRSENTSGDMFIRINLPPFMFITSHHCRGTV